MNEVNEDSDRTQSCLYSIFADIKTEARKQIHA